MATEKIRLVMNRKDVAMVSNTNIPVSVGVRAEVVSELTRELGRMERLVIMLRYTEELTVAEIAAVLEIAVSEVEAVLENIAHRVRRRLAPVYGRARLKPA